MADDLGEKLKALLSDKQAMNAFGSLLGSGAGQDEKQESNDKLVADIKGALSKVNLGQDKRINLLNALKPYMHESKSANLDKAIKILKLTRLTSLFKDL